MIERDGVVYSPKAEVKVVPISVELLNANAPQFAIGPSYKLIEEAGRTCYQSTNKNDSVEITESFIRGLIKSGHTSVLEHLTLSVRIVCDRGTSHQLVRHRHIAVSQQSTRYVSNVPLEVVKPLSLVEGSEEFSVWVSAMREAAGNYSDFIDLGVGKDIARSVLPISTKTELVVSANIREWRHIIQQRSSLHAHENIREVARLLLEEFSGALPVLFEDLMEVKDDKFTF